MFDELTLEQKAILEAIINENATDEERRIFGEMVADKLEEQRRNNSIPIAIFQGFLQDYLQTL